MTTIQSKSALISWIFSKLNKMKRIVHDFWLSFTINNEQIEPKLNGVFVNKYNKIRCWPRNLDYFREFLNSLISLFRIFIYNWSIWKSYLLLVFSFAYFESHQSYLSNFLGFQSIRSVNRIQIMNGKKALFAVT